MRRVVFCVVAGMMSGLIGYAQDPMQDLLNSMMGGEGVEQVDEDTADYLGWLLNRKIPINLTGGRRLMGTGLFTRYQVASLQDYISSNGDILSAAELVLVDGFGPGEVQRLLPFISFRTSAQPGKSSYEDAASVGEAALRTGLRLREDDTGVSYASRLKVEGVGRFDLGLSAKAGMSRYLQAPDVVSGVLSYHGRKNLNTIVLGDYHARFGQGLLLWSGFSMSGFSTAASFCRHPGGVSNAYTLNPSTAHRGMAVEAQFGRTIASVLYDVEGYGAANLTNYSKHGQIGLSVLTGALSSVDWRWNLRRWDVFGEVAYQGIADSMAETVGLSFNPAYRRCISVLFRNYPSEYQVPTASGPRSSTRTRDERGASLAADLGKWTMSVDYAYHPSTSVTQCKALVRYAPSLSDWLSLNIKGTARYRPQDGHPFRTEMRSDVMLSHEAWRACTSLIVCQCVSTAWLGSLETGYVHDDGIGKDRRKLSFHLRWTVFFIGSWDDRIYFYERDIPGTFSVPAYYGSGYALSAVATSGLGHLRLSARASMLDYPSMADARSGKAEFKLQAAFTW